MVWAAEKVRGPAHLPAVTRCTGSINYSTAYWGQGRWSLPQMCMAG